MIDNLISFTALNPEIVVIGFVLVLFVCVAMFRGRRA